MDKKDISSLRKDQDEWFKSRSRMELCVRMAKQLVLKKVEKCNYENLVLSPLSIDIVLNMVAAGSTGGTLEKMLSLLGSQSIDEIKSQSVEMMAIRVSDEPVMCLVNGAWFDKRFTPTVSYNDDVLKGIFDCEANMVDFSTKADEVVDEINAWVEATSRGLIKIFLQRGFLARDTSLILANGLYFKGYWERGFDFDATLTQNRTFYLLNGQTVSVPFMTSRKRYRRCRSLDGFQVLHMPYQSKSKRFSMYFFLPDERDGLQNLLEKLTLDAEYIHQYCALSEQTLDEFWIPKFKFSFDFDVSSTMEEMGIPLPFGGNAEDFDEMVEIPEGLIVPRVFQKSFIEVDEKGTVAAATTLCRAPRCCAPGYRGNTSFVADHPFVFMIIEDRSKLVIFTGAILDPSKGK